MTGLGHIDLIKRHLVRCGFPVEYERYESYIDQILKNVISRGKGIEVNTSGIRQGAGEPMPGLRTLKRYKELGGEIVTVGSDSHRPADVAADFEEAAKLLIQAGFDHVTAYERRRPVPGCNLIK